MQFRKIAFTAFTILMATLAGCATPQISLTKQAQTKMGRVDGILTIPQNNLEVTVPSTNAGSSGLIGVLVVAAIDSVRQANAEKAAAPIMEALQGHEFRPVMASAVKDALSKIDKVKVEMSPRVETVASDSAKRIAFDHSPASAVLFCKVGYRLESGSLIASISAEMFPKAAPLKQFSKKPQVDNPLDAGNAIYRKTFSFTKQAVTATTIQGSLAEAASSLAQQLAADLNHGL